MAAYNVLIQKGNKLHLPLTSALTVDYGHLACIDTATHLATTPLSASAKTTLRPVGIYNETKTGDGTSTVEIKTFEEGEFYWWKNSATNAVTASHLGELVYMETYNTVGSSATGLSVAGTCVGVSSTKGVLVKMRSLAPAVVDAT